VKIALVDLACDRLKILGDVKYDDLFVVAYVVEDGCEITMTWDRGSDEHSS